MEFQLRDLQNAFCDNEDVCKSDEDEAVLIKKHHSIAYHPDRKTVATNKSCVQVRVLHDSVGPICQDKEDSAEREKTC
jgi:hypothetical protein